MDVSREFKDVYMCPGSSWQLFQSWQVALGMLGAVIILLLLAACCCRLCITKDHSRRRGRRGTHRRRTHRTNSSGTVSTISQDSERFRISRIMFNPDAPYAFEPPPYDSLPKCPPEYSAIFGTAELGEGSANQAFTYDISELPPYAIHCATTSVPSTQAEGNSVSTDSKDSEIADTSEFKSTNSLQIVPLTATGEPEEVELPTEETRDNISADYTSVELSSSNDTDTHEHDAANNHNT